MDEASSFLNHLMEEKSLIEPNQVKPKAAKRTNFQFDIN